MRLPTLCLALCAVASLPGAAGGLPPVHELDLVTPDIVVTFDGAAYHIHDGRAPDAPRFDPERHPVLGLWPVDPTRDDGFLDIVLLVEPTDAPQPRQPSLLDALDRLIGEKAVQDAGVDVNACGDTYVSFKRYGSRVESFQGAGPLLKLCKFRGVMEWYDSVE